MGSGTAPFRANWTGLVARCSGWRRDLKTARCLRTPEEFESLQTEVEIGSEDLAEGNSTIELSQLVSARLAPSGSPHLLPNARRPTTSTPHHFAPHRLVRNSN